MLEIQTETLRDAVTSEEADAGDVRAHLRRELITAEALVNTLAASVAERESEVKAQADAFESALERARASDAVADEALVSALKRHDLEAEKHRKREMDRTNLLAAIDGVSETLAFESREERNRMALLEGEALSERAALERSHELIIRETSLRLIRRTDQQLVVTTKRAIVENERRGDALAMASARCEREMRAHEAARAIDLRARARRDAARELNAAANERTETLLRSIALCKKRIADVERDRRAFAENVSQIRGTPSPPTSGRGAGVAAARTARWRGRATRARLREAREAKRGVVLSLDAREGAEKEGCLDAAATSHLRGGGAADWLTSSRVRVGRGFASRLRMQTLDAFAGLEARNIPGTRPCVPGTSPGTMFRGRPRRMTSRCHGRTTFAGRDAESIIGSRAGRCARARGDAGAPKAKNSHPYPRSRRE